MLRATSLVNVLLLVVAGTVVLAAPRVRVAVTPVEVPLPPPGEGVASLVYKLKADDPEVRARAAWALAGAIAVRPSVVDALRAASEDPERQVRHAAIWALGHVDVEVDERGTAPGDRSARVVNDTEATAVRITRPVYPVRAFNDGVQGTVVVDILIGEEGEVAHAEVRQSISGLDRAALQCVRNWQFRPALRGGKPTASAAVAPVSFVITSK